MQLRIATRKSPLALKQAQRVEAELRYHYPALEITILPMTTEGDENLGSTLANAGGKGLFIKNLEQALLKGEADIAVHSLKDLPAQLTDPFRIVAYSKREDPRDAFISLKYASLEELPSGASVGTSSLRRTAQVLAIRPDLTVLPLRGNVNSRLEKLHQGSYDALILASAGLNRLGLSTYIREYLPVNPWVPTAGQGTLAIEMVTGNEKIAHLLEAIDHSETRAVSEAERSLIACLDGNCSLPIGSYATLESETLVLRGWVGSSRGYVNISAEAKRSKTEAVQLGYEVAALLERLGASVLLSAPVR